MISRSSISMFRTALSLQELSLLQNMLRYRPLGIAGSRLATVSTNAENSTEKSDTNAETQASTETTELNAVLLEKDQLIVEKDKLLKDLQVYLC